jgi:ATP-dependent DNA helicase Q1
MEPINQEFPPLDDASSSTKTTEGAVSDTQGNRPDRRERYPSEKSVLKQKIADAERTLSDLKASYRRLEGESPEFEQRIQAPPNAGKSSGSGRKDVIDYGNDKFVWDGPLRHKMREVFGIKDFRLCQKA